MGTINIRPLAPSDAELLVALYESNASSSTSASKRRAARLLHTAFQNPAEDGEPTYFVAERSEQIVGHLGRMPSKFSVQGVIKTGSCLHDFYLATDKLTEDDRKQASKDLFEAAEAAGRNLHLTLWSNVCDAEHSLRDGNHKLESRRFARSFSPRKLSGAMSRGTLGRFVGWMRQNLLVCGDAILSFGHRCRMTFKRCDYFDARYDELAEDLAANSSIAPYKDSAYLNWKYISRPGIDSTIYEAIASDGSLQGYVVIVNPEPDSDVATIADFAARSKSPEIINCLLHFAIAHARKIRARQLVAFPSSPDCEACLTRKMFKVQEECAQQFFARSDLSGFGRLISSIKDRQVGVGSFESPGH